VAGFFEESSRGGVGKCGRPLAGRRMALFNAQGVENLPSGWGVGLLSDGLNWPWGTMCRPCRGFLTSANLGYPPLTSSHGSGRAHWATLCRPSGTSGKTKPAHRERINELLGQFLKQCVEGLKSLGATQDAGGICRAGFQAGTLISSTCPPKGGRYIHLLGLALVLGIMALSPCLVSAQQGAATGTLQSPVQLVQPTGPGQSAAPITITFQDALDRARKYDPTFLGAQSDAQSASEDRTQARAAMLPQVSTSTQYLGTQGDSKIPDGRFVTNDGVHVYRAWGVFHQDLSPTTYLGTGYTRAQAAEALAKAKAEIARRGLTVTVTKDFYALTVSQRKYVTAQQALDQSSHFLQITQDAEREGQAAHSDVIKAQIQDGQQQQAFDEAKLQMEEDRLTLAVLIFPDLNENFTIVDDLDSATALPSFPEVQALASRESPDMRVAMETMREADLDVKAAKAAFLPSLTIDTDYGIEANSFALNSTNVAFPEAGRVPNLGYFVTAALNIPVWDWGTMRSKLHQSEYRQQESKAQASQAQRQLLSNLYASYNEAMVARGAVERTRETANLATESLRLVNLRYQGGSSTVLDVVDAQNTLISARNAYDDAQARYRLALATLQTMTGNF
jgi:outer membrane protein TolC